MGEYRTRHTLALGTELELRIEHHSGQPGYWLTVAPTDADEPLADPELVAFRALSLDQLADISAALCAVIKRFEREEQQ